MIICALVLFMTYVNSRKHPQIDPLAVTSFHMSTAGGEPKAVKDPRNGIFKFIVHFQTVIELLFLLNFADNILPSASAQSKVQQPFSEDMRVEELSLWLRNHPKVGSDFKEDIEILKGIYTNNVNVYNIV